MAPDSVTTALRDVQASIVRLETTLEHHKDHPLRIRILEQFQAKTSFINGLFTAGLTAVVVTVANVLIIGRI